jgi:hypothetical protein
MNKKILEPEPGLVVTLSIWYKTNSNLDVHLSKPGQNGQLHFVQVHFSRDEDRSSSDKIFLVEPEWETCPQNSKN